MFRPSGSLNSLYLRDLRPSTGDRMVPRECALLGTQAVPFSGSPIPKPGIQMTEQMRVKTSQNMLALCRHVCWRARAWPRLTKACLN
jgi:hypothetical protein